MTEVYVHIDLNEIDNFAFEVPRIHLKNNFELNMEPECSFVSWKSYSTKYMISKFVKKEIAINLIAVL
jgi:hypothetical protein